MTELVANTSSTHVKLTFVKMEQPVLITDLATNVFVLLDLPVKTVMKILWIVKRTLVHHLLRVSILLTSSTVNVHLI